MYPLVTFFIFAIVLFFYIHITAQWKKSEDLEVYEMDYINNAQLQETCNVRQPVLFSLDTKSPVFFDRLHLAKMSKLESHDVNVTDTLDYWREESVDAVVMPFRTASKLIESDPYARYLSENNQDFIEESGLEALYQPMDDLLRPAFTVHTKYDILFGSKHASTPMRYHTHHRYYLAVTSGKIHVKMTPWKSSKFLHPIKDYEHYEFRSAVNVYSPQKKYANELDKLHCLDFDVYPGYVLYVPAYWWYSVQYSTDSTTLVAGFTYNTAMDVVSNAKEWGLYYLQQSNITRKVAKSIPSIDGEMHAQGNTSNDGRAEEENAELHDTPPRMPKEMNEQKRDIITNAGIYSV